MLRFYASKFSSLGRSFGKVEGMLDVSMKVMAETMDQTCPQDLRDAFQPGFTAIVSDCEAIQLHSVIDQVQRMFGLIQNHDTTHREILVAFTDLQNRMEDELARKMFFSLSTEEGRMYLEDFPFGETVNIKFRNSAFDVSEAEKSLACSRPTACVFHCMRILEIGLHHLGKKLRVTIREDRNWQNILNDMDKAIGQLPDKPTQAKRRKADLSGAASYLHHVKNAWRNPVMHVRGKYTPEEAQNIFTAVRGFMQYLAMNRGKK